MKKRYLTIILTVVILSAFSFSLFPYNNYYNQETDADSLKIQHQQELQKLNSAGVSDTKQYAAVDSKFKQKALNLEKNRTAALKEIFTEAGLKWPPKYTGTAPSKGRGILGDIDTANMPKKDVKKLISAVERLNKKPGSTQKYTLEKKTGYVKIKELDTTVFRNVKNADKHPFIRAGEKETVIAYKTDPKTGKTKLKNGKPIITDKHIYNLDNVKKIGSDFSSNVNNMDWQNTAKGTARIIKNTYGDNLQNIKDPIQKEKIKKLLITCEKLKSGSSPQALDKISQQEKITLKDEMKQIVKDAVKKTASKELNMASKRDNAWREIENIKQELKASKGKDPELKNRLSKAKNKYNKYTSQLESFRERKLAAERGVLKNDGEEILAFIESKNIKKKYGLSGSIVFEDIDTKKIITPDDLKEQLLSSSRKKLKNTYKTRNYDKTNKKIISTIAPGTPVKPTLGKSPSFVKGVNIADGAVQTWEVWKQSDDFLPKDMDPKTRTGTRIILSATAVTGVPQAIMGGSQAGMDELVKWYKKNPGKEPTTMESLGIGMRGANNFTKDMVKGAVYGVTVKPFKDIHDIGVSAGDAIKQYNNMKKAQAAAKQQTEHTGKVRTSKLNSMDDFLDNAEDIAKKILNSSDTTSTEKAKAKQLLDKIEISKGHVSYAKIDDEGNRTASSLDERLYNYNSALDSALEADKELTKLTSSLNNCFLKVYLKDKETGNIINGFSWLHIISKNYNRVIRSNTGTIIINNIPSGSYTLDAFSSGYQSMKNKKISINAVKKRVYSGTLNLTKEIEEQPVKTPKTEIKEIANDNSVKEEGTIITNPNGRNTLNVNLTDSKFKTRLYNRIIKDLKITLKLVSTVNGNIFLPDESSRQYFRKIPDGKYKLIIESPLYQTKKINIEIPDSNKRTYQKLDLNLDCKVNSWSKTFSGEFNFEERSFQGSGKPNEQLDFKKKFQEDRTKIYTVNVPQDYGYLHIEGEAVGEGLTVKLEGRPYSITNKTDKYDNNSKKYAIINGLSGYKKSGSKCNYTKNIYNSGTITVIVRAYVSENSKKTYAQHRTPSYRTHYYESNSGKYSITFTWTPVKDERK